MATRTTTKKVVFHRPFVLSGIAAVQPAGTYQVDTVEERLDTMSVPAWRRIATNMPFDHGGTTQYVPIDPNELHEALIRDSVQPGAAGTPSAASRRKTARAAMNMRREDKQ